MWILMMNHIDHRLEEYTIVARAESIEILERFLVGQEVQPYEAGFKVFRRGGPLEWYKPVVPIFPHSHALNWQGLRPSLQQHPFLRLPDKGEYCRRAGEEWDRKVVSIPEVF